MSYRVILSMCAIVILGLGISASLNWNAKSRLYNPSELKGLSKSEVKQRLGEPTRSVDNGSLWIYQDGMDPEATLEFVGDKVEKVWSAARDGFDK